MLTIPSVLLASQRLSKSLLFFVPEISSLNHFYVIALYSLAVYLFVSVYLSDLSIFSSAYLIQQTALECDLAASERGKERE